MRGTWDQATVLVHPRGNDEARALHTFYAIVQLAPSRNDIPRLAACIFLVMKGLIDYMTGELSNETLQARYRFDLKKKTLQKAIGICILPPLDSVSWTLFISPVNLALSHDVEMEATRIHSDHPCSSPPYHSQTHCQSRKNGHHWEAHPRFEGRLLWRYARLF